MTLKELRETAKNLLAEGKVDLIIGWGKGSLPMTSTPLFVDSADEAESLIFDSTCANNLSVYFTKDRRKLPKSGKKIGVIVKGCDSRSMVLSISEKQIEKDKVTIIGVPCNGVIDRGRLKRRVEGKEILDFSDDGETVTVKGEDFEQVFPLAEVISSSCSACVHRDAEACDIFLGEAREPGDDAGAAAQVEEFEKLSAAERWESMTEEYSTCIRCYACRNVCPSCYCNICFVDQNDPQWIGKTLDITDTMIFHIIRNLHVAGRCVECGACERACPMDIKLLLLNRKAAKEVRERFDNVTGTKPEEKPAMADFREDENQDFIMG